MFSFTLTKLGYGLDGPGFESQHGKEVYLLSETSKPALLPIEPPIQWVTAASFPRGKWAEA